MAYISIDEERCKSCGLCVENCPKYNISMSTVSNSTGYKPAKMINPDNCNGCGNCYIMCPDLCIEVYR